MKKIFLRVLALFLMVPLSAQAAGRVVDDANLFSSSEIANLESRLSGLSPETFVVTAEDAGGLSTASLANDFFDRMASQNEGSLFLIDMDNRELFIVTAGSFSRIDIEPILDWTHELVADGNFYGAAQTFIDEISLAASAFSMEHSRIIDEISGLTASELSNLNQEIAALESQMGAEFFVLLTEDSRGLNHSELGDAFGDYLESMGSANGILLLIDYDNMELSVHNWGTTQAFLQGNQRDDLIDIMTRYLNSEDNAGAIGAAVAQIGELHARPQTTPSAVRWLAWLGWLSGFLFYFTTLSRFRNGKPVPNFLLKKRRQNRVAPVRPTQTFGGGSTFGSGGHIPRRRGMGPFGWFMMGRMSAPRRRRSPWGMGGGWDTPRPRAPRPPRPAAPKPAPKPPQRSSSSGLFGSGNTQQRSSSSKTFGSGNSQQRSSSSKTFGSGNRSGSGGSFGGGRSGGMGSFGSGGSRPSSGGSFGSRPSGPRGGGRGGGGGGGRGGGGRKF